MDLKNMSLGTMLVLGIVAYVLFFNNTGTPIIPGTTTTTVTTTTIYIPDGGCVDTETGLNQYEKGCTSVEWVGYPNNIRTLCDYCQGQTLVEVSCASANDDGLKYTNIVCSGECSAGRCV